jgi:hypothetical protein
VSRGSVIAILRDYPKKDSCKVKFDVPDENNSYIDIIKAKELRTNKELEDSICNWSS